MTVADTVSLKEHFDRILLEKEKALDAALAAAKEAVDKAEKNAERWRAEANEWRGAMNDREKNFMPRAEFEAYKENVNLTLAALTKTENIQQGKGQGLSLGWAILLGAMGVITFIVTVLPLIN